MPPSLKSVLTGHPAISRAPLIKRRLTNILCQISCILTFALISGLSTSALASQSTIYPNVVGNFSYSYEPSAFDNTVNLNVHIDKLQNPSTSRTTGPLEVELWAVAAPWNGVSGSGIFLARHHFTTADGHADGKLEPGQSFDNVSFGYLSYRGESGSYYVVLRILEYTSACGWCDVNFENFPSTLVSKQASTDRAFTNYSGTSAADDFSADFNTTGLVSGASPATGNIESTGDRDWFRVRVIPGTTYRFNVLGARSNGGTLAAPSMTLYASVGFSLGSNSSSGPNSDPQLTYRSSSTDVVYVAVNGSGTSTGTYTVTATSTLRGVTIFSTAQNASQSFLRFYNAGTGPGTVTALLYSDTTGQLAGQWTSPTIPAGAELQYSIGTIEDGAGITGAKPNYYEVALQSTIAGYFQHVLFRPSDGTLTNLSTCAGGVTAAATTLTGIHTTLLSQLGFPSTIVVTNTGAAATNVVLGLYDARDGTKLGTYTTPPIPANGEATIAVATIENSIGNLVSDGMYHYVIRAETAFNGFLQNLVNNQRAGVVTDMTTACALNTPVATTGSWPLRGTAIFSTAQSASQSFLRLYNTGTRADTVQASLYDYTTGQLRGQWTSPSIPAGAELQYDIATIENGAKVAGTKPNYYAISIDPRFDGYFQHVLFRPSDGTLTNLSTCAAGITADARNLSGVHSSILGNLGFPSSVVVANTGSAAATAALSIYDARDGTSLGTYTTASIPVNGVAVVAIGAIEAAIGKAPTSGMYHYVIKASTSFNGFLQHLVNNQKAGVVTDMTTACSLVAPVAFSVRTAGTGSGSVTLSPLGVPITSTISSYSPGTIVTLTASANSGSTFAGWSGIGCSGTSPTCQLAVDSGSFATATFNLAGGTTGGTNTGTGGSSCPTMSSNPLATVSPFGPLSNGDTGTITLISNSGSPTSGTASICSSGPVPLTGTLNYSINLSTTVITLTGSLSVGSSSVTLNCSVSPTGTYAGTCGPFGG